MITRSSFRHLFLYLLGIAVSVLIVETSGATPQRMALPQVKGLRLSPAVAGQSIHKTKLPAICLNQARRSPLPRDQFSHLLTEATDCFVHVGEKKLSLKEAIAKNLITIRGVDGLIEGSHTELEIINNTSHVVSIDIGSPIAVSAVSADHLRDIPDFHHRYRTFTEKVLPAERESLEQSGWRHYEELQAQQLGRLLSKDITLTRYKELLSNDGVLGVAHLEAGPVAMFFEKGRYTARRVDGGQVVEWAFDHIDRSKDGKLTADCGKMLDIAQEHAFAAGRGMSTSDDVECINLGIPNAHDGLVPIQVGKVNDKVEHDALLRFLNAKRVAQDAHETPDVPQKLKKAIEASRAKQFIIWKSYYQKDDQWGDWGRIVERLSVSYPDREFILDGDDPQALERVQSQPLVKGGSDVAFINREKSLPVEYQQIVSSQKATLERSGSKVIDGDNASVVDYRNVIIVSGDKTAEFQDFLQKLHNDGSLNGKVVVLFSCGTGNEDSFNRFLLSFPDKSRPFAIVYYPDKLHPEAVRRVIKRLAILLDSPSLSGGKRIQQLIRDAVNFELDRAIKDVETNETLIDALQKLRTPVLQVSQITAVRLAVPA